MMEEYKRKYSEVSEKLMERNRQYQKLQALYDSLRLRNMVVDVGERDSLHQATHHSFITGENNIPFKLRRSCPSRSVQKVN